MIQLYAAKKNFDTQKALRFFKERRIPYQYVDLEKHKLGERELDLFIRAAGSAAKLVDRRDKRALNHPAAHMDTDSLVRAELLTHPQFLVSPIIRSGTCVVIGFDSSVLDAWTKES